MSSLQGLPQWPSSPEPVDPTGRSWLVVACGEDPPVRAVAEAWAAAAEDLGVVTPLRLAGADGPRLAAALDQTRIGVRIMIVGDEYDVLRGLAVARAHGASPVELRSFVVPGGALPIYCAHCRDTHRVERPQVGGVDCPGCDRHLDVHQHHSALRGSYLASDSRARDIG